MYKIKNTIALAITLVFGLSSVWTFAATWDTTPAGEQFAMKEVTIVDASTLKVSFTKDLLEDISMFEFLLTSKKDDTKEISLTGIILSSPAELTASTVTPLAVNEEYNLVVVFASDKEWKIIENGVDSMITFKTPENFPSAQPAVEEPALEEPMDAAPVVEPVVEEPVATPIDTAAWEATTLPQTGTQEMMIVIFAMMLGLGFMYSRRKA